MERAETGESLTAGSSGRSAKGGEMLLLSMVEVMMLGTSRCGRNLWL
jgi:hypothetical protein